MHITLKFVGDTPQASLPQISDVLTSIVAEFATLEIRIRGLGAFPSLSRPSILWAALEQTEPVEQLAARLEGALVPLGFEPEQRSYTPHLTLARLRQTKGRRGQHSSGSEHFLQLLHEHQGTDFGAVGLTEAILYESELTDSGPIYTPLRRASFKAG